MYSSHHRAAKRGFTLIELLVVIAIIAVLAAILFPVFAKAREKAQQATCTNNQRQIAVAIQTWAQDHSQTYPAVDTIWGDISLDKGVFICPTKGKKTANAYVYNSYIAGKTMSEVTDPSSKMLIADGVHAVSKVPNSVANAYYGPGDYEYRHNKAVIAACADGHVAVTLAPPITYFDGTFNEDTLDAAPPTATYNSFIHNPRITAFTVGNGNSIKVVDEVGLMKDQPLQLIEGGSDGGGYTPQIEYQFPAITTGKVRIEWDSMMVSYAGTTAYNTLTFRLLGTENNGTAEVHLGTISYLTENGGYGKNYSLQLGFVVETNYAWAFGVPNHFIVDIDLNRDTYTIIKDDKLMAKNKVRTNGFGSITRIRFTDASAIGGGVTGFSAVVDNVKITNVPSL